MAGTKVTIQRFRQISTDWTVNTTIEVDHPDAATAAHEASRALDILTKEQQRTQPQADKTFILSGGAGGSITVSSEVLSKLQKESNQLWRGEQS